MQALNKTFIDSRAKRCRLFLFVLIGASSVSIAATPLPPKDSLFAVQSAALADAAHKQVDVLAPTTFAAAKDALADAAQDYDKGRKLEKIRNKIKDSATLLVQASKLAQNARAALATPLAARDDAVTAQADKYAHDAWLRAAQRFAEAAAKVEKDNISGAQKLGAESEVLLRDAELLAIKGRLLGEAQTLIAKADAAKVMELAPRTLTAAKKYLQQAESEIDRNRYDSDVPSNLAEQAAYEARHALYLANIIAPLQKKPKNEQPLEDLLLKWEDSLKQISATLELSPRFDAGDARPLEDILKHLQQLQTDNRKLKQSLEDRDAQVKSLTAEIKRVEDKLGGVSEERVALQRRLDAQAQLRANISQVENAFTANEANVFRQSDDLVISLTGITFPVGKSSIEPASFALMSKVQEVLKLFPNVSLIVEGHTDSDGSDSANLILSQDRADAVKQYLVSNAGIDAEKITSIGYGESRPVASNQTPQGKARNRRIDLVIHLGALPQTP